MVSYFVVYDLESPDGRELTGTQMVKLARRTLRASKINGLDQEFKAKDISTTEDAVRYLVDFANFKIEKGRIPNDRQWMVVDENLKPMTGMAGVRKSLANKVARDLNMASKDKKHRMHFIAKGHTYKVMRYVR